MDTSSDNMVAANRLTRFLTQSSPSRTPAAMMPSNDCSSVGAGVGAVWGLFFECLPNAAQSSKSGKDKSKFGLAAEQ